MIVRNRFWNAYMIQQGASNPSGIARDLVEAIDEVRAENPDTANVCEDVAVRLIAHHLAFLLDLVEYDHDLSAYGRDMDIAKANAKPAL